MDLRLLLRVLWRFKYLMALGIIVAGGLAFMTVERVSFGSGAPKLSPRQSVTWGSSSLILVTQPGFPIGRSVRTGAVPLDPSSPQAGVVPKYQDPSSLTGTALLYAQLATSDQVRAVINQQGPLPGTYAANVETSPAINNSPLPLIAINAVGPSAAAATDTVRRATEGLLDYVTAQQVANGIAPDLRIVLQPLVKSAPPTIVKGRSIMRPLAVFAVILTLFTILACVLENLRPRVRPKLGLAGAHEPEPQYSRPAELAETSSAR